MLLVLLLVCSINGFRPQANNSYILVSTSKFWFNMRQAINSLLIYNQLKEFGISDDNILLMIPEDTACNRKNNRPGTICAYDEQSTPNLYKDVEWDYKRDDVNIKNWIDVMRGKYNRYTPQSRRLRMSRQSRILMYINGHGGDGYIKMQDTTYLLDFEMAKVTKEMQFLDLYNEAYLQSDSCGASTLFEMVEANNMILLGSSSATEKSYSHGKDSMLLMPKTDRFSLTTHNFLQDKLKGDSPLTIADQYAIYIPKEQKCNAKLMINHPYKQARDFKLVDFWKNKVYTPMQILNRRDQSMSLAKQQFMEMM